MNTSQLWWHISRAAGLVSWALALGSVIWGLALSTRVLGRKPPAPWLLDLHRFLGALTIVFVGIHLVGLTLDKYVGFGLSELFVPFATTWKPGAVAWGIVAFYLLLAVELTSLVKKRLPKRVWWTVHLSSYLVYGFGTVHLLAAGTDARNLLVRVVAIVSIGAVTFFTAYRVMGPGKAGSIGARPAGRGAPATRPLATVDRAAGDRARPSESVA